MELKYWNRFLLVVVATLLCSVILVLIKIFFSGREYMDLGSVTDWLSFICDLAMAIAAVYAALNAKNWIRNKQNDSAYNHVNTLMVEYDQISETLQKLYFKVTTTNVLDPNFESLRHEIEKNAYRIIELNSKLEASKRWRIGYDNDVSDRFNVLLTFCNDSYALIGAHLSNNPEKVTEGIDLLSNHASDIKKQKDFFNKDITEIFTFPNE